MADRDRPAIAAEAELTLLLVGTRARREAARDRITDLARAVDDDALMHFLARQRLLTLVGTRLAAVAPGWATPRFDATLTAALRVARLRGMLLGSATAKLAAALEREGIAAVALKGAGLAEDLHGDPALRDSADVDVLVSAGDLPRAVAVAREVGWPDDIPSPVGVPDGLPRLHHALRDPSGRLPALELHWRIHWYETEFAAQLLERSESTGGVRRIAPLDQLAALLLFYARDGLAGLRLAADIAAWWDRHGDALAVTRLERLAQEHPRLAEAWRVALCAVTPVVGLPIEPFGGAVRPSRRRAVLACRLTDWELKGDADQIMANVALVDGLLSPSGDLRGYARRHVVPPRHALIQTYGLPANARLRMPACLAGHVARLLTRHTLALWGLRRGRRWSPLPFSAARRH